ncbi:MAG: hypothetical protein ACRD2Q_12465 [Terriglobales bacterium]
MLVALAVLPAPAHGQPKQDSIQVLVLFFGDRDAPAAESVIGQFRATLEEHSNVPVWIYSESLAESAAAHNPDYERMMAATLSSKYGDRKIDLVLALGAFPLQFAAKYRKQLLPDAQLLYVLLESPTSTAVRDATGVVWRLNLVPTVEMALARDSCTLL